MDDGLDVNGHSSCLDSTLRLAQLVSSFPHWNQWDVLKKREKRKTAKRMEANGELCDVERTKKGKQWTWHTNHRHHHHTEWFFPWTVGTNGPWIWRELFRERKRERERKKELWNEGGRDSCRKRAYNDSVAVYEWSCSSLSLSLCLSILCVHFNPSLLLETITS